ncbi:MAG: TRAP transporter substrate-binding protein [Dehalococcoidia bacterium]|nr:MAG: TRAP transporter substrate-binding protein [Dehalococcoidia bacterium]
MGKFTVLLNILLAIVLIAGTVGCNGGEATQTPAEGTPPGPTAEPITLKFVSSTTHEGVAAEAYNLFADLVEEYTDGRVTVDLFLGSQLFPVTEELEAVVTGAVDIMADASYWIFQYVPDVMVFYVDGVWEGREHAYAALEESELPRVLAERIEEAGPVKVLGFMPASLVMGIINSVKESTHMKALEGFRINSSPGSPPAPIYDYMGMVGVPLAYEEVPTSFMQGILDAVQITSDSMVSLRLYETGNHVLWRISSFPNLVMIMNEDSWESLPADARDIIITEVMPEVYEFAKTKYREIEEVSVQTIAENVETVNWVTQEDLHAYVEYARDHPVWKTQMLMVDPEIVEIIEDCKRSSQQYQAD